MSTGCKDPARPHIERLLNEWAVVIAEGYVHSDKYSQDEQRIHFFHEQSRATNQMLTKFLDDDPPVKDDLKDFLRVWRAVAAESEKLHEKMIDEGRFTYNGDEKARAETLTKAEALAGMELMEHVKGY
jgi:hypothetical protein